MARWTWPIDAAAIGTGSQSTNSCRGRCAELALDHLGGELAGHRRRLRLELSERERAWAPAGPRRGSSPSGRASSARPSSARDVRRRRRRSAARAPVERATPLRRREHLARRRRGVHRADVRPEAGELDVAPEPTVTPHHRRSVPRRPPRTVRRDPTVLAFVASAARWRTLAATKAAMSRGTTRVRMREPVRLELGRLERSITAWHARSSTGTNASALATTASWPPSTRNASAPVIAWNRRIWRRTGTTVSRMVMTTDVGTSTSPSQSRAENEPMRATRLEDHPPIVAGHLLDRPGLPRLGLALQEELVGQPDPGPQRRRPATDRRVRTARGSSAARLVRSRSAARWRRARGLGRARGGAATPAARPARPSSTRRRVTPIDARGRRAAATASSAQSSSRNGLARTRSRRPWPRWSSARTRYVLGQLGVARVEVEVGGRRPAVQQQDRRRVRRRAGELAHERDAAAGELDSPSAGAARRGWRRLAAVASDGDGPELRPRSMWSALLHLEDLHADLGARRCCIPDRRPLGRAHQGPAHGRPGRHDVESASAAPRPCRRGTARPCRRRRPRTRA